MACVGQKFVDGVGTKRSSIFLQPEVAAYRRSPKHSRQRMLISAARVISRTSRCNGDFSCQVGRPADRITMNRGLPRDLLRSLPSQPRVGLRTARPLILRGLISMNKFRTPWAHGTGPVSQADISR
jgi:hypothetical protein